MKSLHLIIFLVLSSIMMISCEKNESKTIIAESYDPNAAKLKVIYASAYVIRDSIQIKINDVRVSNTFLGNNASNFSTPFPGGGINTGGDNRPFYLNVTPGNTKLYISVPKKNTNIDSILRFNGQINLEAGKYYSAFITDTLFNASVVLTEDNQAPVANKFSRFKFVNLIPNAPSVDLYFGNLLIAANVAYKSVSPEFTLPADSASQFKVFTAGALPTTTPIVAYPPTVAVTNPPTAQPVYTILNQRGMTIFAKGYSSGTAARSPIISLLYTK